jgi:MarR family transcriptional regulator, multiple antibiotic resistance protein MarR
MKTMISKDYSEIENLISQGDEFQDLHFLFARARYALFRDREKELMKHGLTPEQAQVLFVVQALGSKCTSSEISRILVRQPHTVSAIINRMEERGFVKKVRDMQKKNWVRVAITEKGEKAAAVARKVDPIPRVLGVLNQEERQIFRDYLERILSRAREDLGLTRDNLPLSD